MAIMQRVYHSRIQRLSGFASDWYVKREDELSGAIRGNKLRKYASLVPYLCAQNIQRLIIIAGPQSNNLLAALQIAREQQWAVTAFLLKPWSRLTQGNFEKSSLFLAEQDIIWVTRQQWPDVESIALAWQSGLDENSFLLKEGAAVPPAFSGAMSLGEDIQRNEDRNAIKFDQIVIDAGTGFSAIALGHWLQKNNHPAQLHVVLMADDEKTFLRKAQYWLGYEPNHLICHRPATARSFGSVNQTVRDEIKLTAMQEGFLLDPIYSAKMFLTARALLREDKLSGKVLLIHSG